MGGVMTVSGYQPKNKFVSQGGAKGGQCGLVMCKSVLGSGNGIRSAERFTPTKLMFPNIVAVWNKSSSSSSSPYAPGATTTCASHWADVEARGCCSSEDTARPISPATSKVLNDPTGTSSPYNRKKSL